MFRRDKWWTREIEKINRANEAERARLLETIAHLAGRPLPTGPTPDRPEPEYEPPELIQPDFYE